ncbi:MAG: FCD domain-containing protein [Actinoallomurus sp.]
MVHEAGSRRRAARAAQAESSVFMPKSASTVPRSRRGRPPHSGRRPRRPGARHPRSADGDAREFARADRCFHRTMVAAAGNEIITQLYDALRGRQPRMARLTADDPDRTATAIHDHAEILEAVRTGDRERIRAAVHRHLRTAVTALRGHA